MYYQKRSKKGVGHIEIIVSFVIFIAFVLFILFFFRPTDNKRLINTSIDYVFLELKRNASIDIDQYSFKINTELVSVPNEIAISISDISQEKKVRAEDIDGNELTSKKIGSNKVIVNRDGKDFASLLFSEDFAEEVNNLQNLEVIDGSYTPGVFFSDSLISERRLKGVIEYYNTNYIELKNDFNLPDRVNFGISLTLKGVEDDEVEIKAEKPVPQGLEVFTEKRRVQILRESGEREFADIKVTIW